MTTALNPEQPLVTWAGNHPTPPGLRNVFLQPIAFISQRLVRMVLSRTAEEWSDFCGKNMRVVALFDTQYLGQTFQMPVVKITLSDEVETIIWYDFNEWVISIDSPRPVDVEFMSTFDTLRVNLPLWYLHDEWVYQPYAANKRRFTAVLPTQHHVFTFFWIFTREFLEYRQTGEFGEGPRDVWR